MNISPIKNTNDYKNNISFNGPLLSSTFMAINKHEIIGVSAIDLLSMVIPRTVVDFTRNKEAGTETMIREISSTATHAAIGISGVGAAALLSQGLKHKNYDVDFKAFSANSDTIDGMAKVFKTVLDKNPRASKEQLTKKFLYKIFEDVKGLGGNSELNDKTLWYSLKSNNQIIKKETINTKKSIIDILLAQHKSNPSFKLPQNVLNQLEAYMNIDIPSTQQLKVRLAGKELMTNGEHFLSDAYTLSKSFTQDNVLKTFKKSKDALASEFIKDLKRLSIGKTTLGLAAICAVALSIQTINRHLTKKRTGLSGFVGDPDYMKKDMNNQNITKEKDPWFLPLKALALMGMGFFIVKTINAKNLKDFISKIQFKGNLPTMEQIKLVYGSTILGRLFASSDKNELRESSFRDFLGYTNFLVLCSLITKCFVNWKDKSLINYDANTQGKSLWNWLKNSSIKTHQEVVNSTLKTAVIEGNGIKSLKEIYKNNWIQPTGQIADKLKVLNKAKLIGMAYACIALGIFVPIINKYVTERKSKNKSVNVSTKDSLPTVQTATDSKTHEIINSFLQKSNNN